jgi:histidinol-phosphate aminotransferase
VRHNTTERARLTESLTRAGVTVPPSQGNFVLARFPGGAEMTAAADRFLRSRSIITRRMDGYGLPDSLRITIGLVAECDAVAAALDEFMKAEGSA